MLTEERIKKPADRHVLHLSVDEAKGVVEIWCDSCSYRTMVAISEVHAKAQHIREEHDALVESHRAEYVRSTHQFYLLSDTNSFLILSCKTCQWRKELKSTVFDLETLPDVRKEHDGYKRFK